ncbi:recombinase family protein [Halococcus hamelinensis]|uniref:recombinase family protein n=1 Tax=Halococcus hamelinensis TaxID=332168 RepID=UPI001ED8E721|nr:recombinase family protein [Halococcus hamelinensis]
MVQSAAIYARVSTPEQHPQRQLNECREHIVSKFPEITSIETYTDIISGVAKHGGEQYRELNEAIKNDDYDLVVVHEISRLSRLGAGEIHRFIQRCMERGTVVESLDLGLSIHVEDSPIQRTIYTMIASIMGDLAKIEHEQDLLRIQSGIRAAQQAGRWTGRPPRGFVTDENGVLHVDIEEFLKTREALLRLKHGERKLVVAERSGIPRSTLVGLFRDEQRRAIYLDGVATDERLNRALAEFRAFSDLAPNESKRRFN